MTARAPKQVILGEYSICRRSEVAELKIMNPPIDSLILSLLMKNKYFDISIILKNVRYETLSMRIRLVLGRFI